MEAGGNWQDGQLKRSVVGMWPLPFLGALVAMFGVRFLVSPDGGGYLRSARVIFGPNMDEQYQFIREPGLPILIRLAMMSPVSDNLIFVAVQGMMAGTAIAAVGAALHDFGTVRQRLVAGTVALFAPVYISYSGMVSQQVGAALILALMGLNLRWIMAARSPDTKRVLCLAVLGAIGGYWMYTFIYVSFLIACTLGVWFSLRHFRKGDRWSPRGLLVALVLIIMVGSIPLVTYHPWAAYRDARLPSNSSSLNASTGLEIRGDAERLGFTGFLQDRLGSTLALLQLQELAKRPIESVGREVIPSEDVHWSVMATASQTPECGVFDVAPSVLPEIRSWMDLSCQPVDLSHFWASMSRLSRLLGGISSAIYLSITIWAFVRRHDLIPVLLVPWFWVGIYAVTGSSHAIDRYAIPIWPYKATMAALVIMVGIDSLLKSLGRVRAQSTRSLPVAHYRTLRPSRQV